MTEPSSLQSLSAQVTYAVPMRQQSMGTLTLENRELMFTDTEGNVQFKCGVNEITKIKDHNSAQLTLYTQDNKPHYIYFSQSRDALFSGARFGHIKEWIAANEAAQPIIQPWIDYFQQEGLIVHGSNAVKNQKLLVRLFWIMIGAVALALLFGIISSIR